MMEQSLTVLVSRLLAHRVIPRSDALARRALLDDAFRAELDQRLAAVGLRLVENPYAEHIAVALLPAMTEPVFGSGEAWLNNNLGLPIRVTIFTIRSLKMTNRPRAIHTRLLMLKSIILLSRERITRSLT